MSTFSRLTLPLGVLSACLFGLTVGVFGPQQEAVAAPWDAEQLAADPEKPDGKRHRPPETAFGACSTSSIGDACNFSIHDRKIEGTCRETPEDRLACVPKNRPSGPPGGGGNGDGGQGR